MSRPQSKYVRVNPSDPEAAAVCDRCSRWRNRTDLVFQMQWAGTHLYSTGSLVCKEFCFDTPNEQFRTIILPPDPPPVINSRVPNFEYEETGPVQSTLTATVDIGGILLPVVDVTGFENGMTVLVQLANSTFAETQVTGVDVTNNILSILNPLTFAAPNMGVVSVPLTD